jgi:hypothetical protein
VVKGGDGTPIVLHLRSLDQNPVRYYDGYEEVTTKDGVFRFADIAPGLYQLESETSGFTLVVPETITLHAGERRKRVIVSL